MVDPKRAGPAYRTLARQRAREHIPTLTNPTGKISVGQLLPKPPDTFASVQSGRVKVLHTIHVPWAAYSVSRRGVKPQWAPHYGSRGGDNGGVGYTLSRYDVGLLVRRVNKAMASHSVVRTSLDSRCSGRIARGGMRRRSSNIWPN